MFPENIKEDFHHCLKCGLCQSVCPTFRVMRQEHYSPRGRVQIIKHYLEGDLQITRDFEEAILSCILCDACASLCPSGVQIDRLFRNMRVNLVDATGINPVKKVLFSILSSNSRLRTAAGIAGSCRDLLVDKLGVSWKLGNVPLNRLPRVSTRVFRERIAERIVPARRSIGKVLFFVGCATDLIFPDIGRSVVTILQKMGFEVLVSKEQVCCSAPIFLSGAAKSALPSIFKNLDILDRTGVDAIVTDCATCGAALKKGIPQLLEDLGLDKDKAQRVSRKVIDISQIVAENLDRLEIGDLKQPVKVTYHDPCHLGRGMAVTAEPTRIIRSIGNVEFVEMEGPNECCGGGGSYQFEKRRISDGISSRKRDCIVSTGANIVATGCPGCMLTLAGSLCDDGIEILHTSQLLKRSLL